MSKSRDITLRGVVIGRAQAGEGSVRVDVLTDEYGLVSALATSGREERSKLRSHLQVGTYGTYTLVKGVGTWRVVGATDVTNSHFSVAACSAEARQAKQQASSRVISLVRQLVKGEVRDAGLFDALWEFVVALPSIPDGEVAAAERRSVGRILAALGYVPESVLGGTDAGLVRAINEGLAASGLA